MLDMDSSVSPTHGDQERYAWSGHFDCSCHHPPATVSVQPVRNLECCALRHGNVHSAGGWQEVLQDEIARWDPIAIVQITSALWEPIYEWKISIGVAEVDETGCRQRQQFSGELSYGHDPSRCIAPGSHSNQ